MRKSILLIIILFVSLLNNLFASGNAGRTGLSFLKIGVGAKATAMGEAFSAVANDFTAIYWNPAGLTNIESSELGFVHNEWIEGVRNEFIAISLKTSQGPELVSGFGLSINFNSVNGIEQRVIPSEEPLSIMNAYDLAVGISFARQVINNLSVGVTAKYLYEKIYLWSTGGLGIDFGLLYKSPLKGLDFSFVGQNFGKMGKLEKEEIILPSLLKIGTAYKPELLSERFIFSIDMLKYLETDIRINLGTEFNYKIFYLRGGYQIGYSAKSSSFGFGLNIKNYFLDYAFVPLNFDLGNSHRISFRIRF